MSGVGVLGGSNLGYAYAADLARRGAEVTLWVRSPENHHALLGGEPLRLSGVMGEHELQVEATEQLERALRHPLLVVGVPSWGNPDLADALRGRLRADQALLLTPGNGGAVELLDGVAPAAVAETAHPVFGARRVGPNGVELVARAVRLPTGALPASRVGEVVTACNELLGQDLFVPAASVLDAALNNPNPIFHTVPCVLNIGYLEGEPSFHLYRDGMSAGVLAALYAADAERIALREALGYGPPHYPQWTILEPGSGPSDEPALFEVETFRLAASSPEYHGPHSLDHRFIDEDTANLVLWVQLARLAGVATPVMDGVVALVGAAARRDYHAQGRSLERVGLPTHSVAAVLDAVA